MVFLILSQLDHRIQEQETKDSGWRIHEINSMTITFYITTELNGSSYVEISLKNSAVMNIGNDDKFCFLWSILAELRPCNISHPNRVSNYRQFFNELNNNGFDSTNGFKCSDVHKFEKLNNLSKSIFEVFIKIKITTNINYFLL